MYKKILVSELIDEGQRLLEALRRQRFPVVAALWSYIPESLEWRLILVTPTVEHTGPMAAYTRVQHPGDYLTFSPDTHRYLVGRSF